MEAKKSYISFGEFIAILIWSVVVVAIMYGMVRMIAFISGNPF